MIAYCGLDCEKCDAYIATKNNDDALRKKIADEWAKTYNAPITSADINCVGCKADGPKIRYCRELCEIRKCATGKGFDSCAVCQSMPCDKLAQIYNHAPDAKANLELLRKSSK